jgi:hypothetical protein
MISTERIENIVPQQFISVAWVSVAAETRLPSRCLAMNFSSGSTIPGFRRHVTILNFEYHKWRRIYWLDELLLASQEELYSIVQTV